MIFSSFRCVLDWRLSILSNKILSKLKSILFYRWSLNYCPSSRWNWDMVVSKLFKRSGREKTRRADIDPQLVWEYHQQSPNQTPAVSPGCFYPGVHAAKCWCRSCTLHLAETLLLGRQVLVSSPPPVEGQVSWVPQSSHLMEGSDQ